MPDALNLSEFLGEKFYELIDAQELQEYQEFQEFLEAMGLDENWENDFFELFGENQ